MGLLSGWMDVDGWLWMDEWMYLPFRGRLYLPDYVPKCRRWICVLLGDGCTLMPGMDVCLDAGDGCRGSMPEMHAGDGCMRAGDACRRWIYACRRCMPEMDVPVHLLSTQVPASPNVYLSTCLCACLHAYVSI